MCSDFTVKTQQKLACNRLNFNVTLSQMKWKSVPQFQTCSREASVYKLNWLQVRLMIHVTDDDDHS